MVVVHVTHAVLREDLRSTAAFRIADVAFGLVAPAFLFCVGASFALRPSSPLGPRLLRAAGLVALGYAMHASGLVGYVRSGAPGELALFLQSDILQVIACALAVLAVSARVTPARWPWAALLLGALALGAGPFVGDVGARAPRVLAPYLTYAVTTQFPLFPWLAYTFVAAGARGLTSRAGAPDGLLALAVAAVVAAIALVFLPLPPHDPYRSGPSNAAVRFALVALFAWALGRVPRPPRPTAPAPAGPSRNLHGRLDGLLGLLGRRSLFLYVVHVALVYGRHPFSLRTRVGAALGVPGVVIAVAATLSAMTLLTWGWDRLSDRRTSAQRPRVRSWRP